MKKIIVSLCTFLLLILSTSSLYAQSTYQIYVHDIDSQKTTYQVGETINGTFILSNLAEIAQSDVYYTISSGFFSEKDLSVTGSYGTTEKQGPLYIKSNSKDIIPFTYTLPPSLSGNIALHIVATLKDGTLVGESDFPIVVKGEAETNPISIIDSMLYISGFEESISPLTGPTIYPEESIEFIYSLTPTDESIVLNPILKLYDRVDNNDALKQTIKLDPIIVDETDNVYTVSLPVDLEPLVYYGVISFENNRGQVLFTTPLRYIIAGPIATVRNITTETLEVKKGDVFDIQVSYGGQPVDEFRPNRQTIAPNANITVVASNEKGETIATVTQSLNLQGNSRTLNLSLTSQTVAEKISFSSTITSAEGVILDQYSTNLPSNDDVKNQQSYDTKSKFNLLTIITLTILLGLILVIVLLKRKYNSFNIPLTVIVFGMLLGLGMFSLRTVLANEITSEAQAYLDSLIGSDGGSGWKVISKNGFSEGDLQNNWFNVTSVSSPLPPKIKIYEPGENFSLTFSATYGDCNNEQRKYQASVYSPSISWWNKSPSYIGTNSTFTDRISYWDRNGIKLLDWQGGDSWKELFLKADLKAVSGISAGRETALKDLVRILGIDEYCPNMRYCATGGDKLLRISLYQWTENPDDIRDAVTWIKNNTDRITGVQTILYGTGAIGAELGKYNFLNTANLKIKKVEQKDARGNIYYEYEMGDAFTVTYFDNLKKLKNKTYEYSQNTVDKFQVWFSQGEHIREILPVTLNKTYSAPTTPGYHLIHFYLMQDGVGEYKDITVRQTICVRGAGVCPNESSRPVVNITKIDAITTTTANLTWTYSDYENDKQSDYQIEVSTQSNFTDLAQIKTFLGNGQTRDVSTIRMHTMTGLKPNTTYYVRIMGKAAAAPYWSYWAYAASPFKTLPDATCDTSHQESEKTCSATRELEYYCANGVWETQETGNTCEEKSGFSCRVTNNPVLTNTNALYTTEMINGGVYQWYGSDGITPIGNPSPQLNIYMEAFKTPGNYVRYVKFTKDGEDTKSASCIANVDTCTPRTPTQCTLNPDGTRTQIIYSCNPDGTEKGTTVRCSDNQCDPTKEICTPGGGGGGGNDAVVKKFEFKPKIVKDGNLCPLYLEVERAASCYLESRTKTYPLTVLAGNIISLTGTPFEVGTYSLYCKGLDPTAQPTLRATRSCISSPEIKEN